MHGVLVPIVETLRTRPVGQLPRGSALRASRRRATALILACLAASAPSPAQDPSVALKEIQVRMERTASAFRDAEGIAVHPAVISGMSQQALQFAGIFCLPDDSSDHDERCLALFRDLSDTAFDRIVTGYLSSASTLSPEIETLYDRFARQVGRSAEEAGWRSTETNRFGLAEIPDGVGARDLFIVADIGRMPLGRVSRSVLLPPGRHTLIAADTPLIVDMVDRRRVKLSLDATSDAPSMVAAGLSYRVDTPADRYCIGQDRPDIEAFNTGRAQLATPSLSAYARLAGLDIALVDSASRCTSDCQQAVASLVARAVLLWRAACGRCDSTALSVLRVGPVVFFDLRIIQFLQGDWNTPVVPADLKISGTGIQSTFYTGRASVTALQRIDASAPFIRRFCQASGRTDIPWWNPAQELACGASRNDVKLLRSHLILHTGPTSCGRAPDFVACGTPEGNVELTLDGIGYELIAPGGAGTFMIGAADLPLDLEYVLMHEVGHWLGIPHLVASYPPHSRVVNVMAEVYARGGFCVSRADVTALNNAADTRWDQRLAAKTCTGLRLPESSTESR